MVGRLAATRFRSARVAEALCSLSGIAATRGSGRSRPLAQAIITCVIPERYGYQKKIFFFGLRGLKSPGRIWYHHMELGPELQVPRLHVLPAGCIPWKHVLTAQASMVAEAGRRG